MCPQMFEYKVVDAHDTRGWPDQKVAQEVCDKMAAEGWRLVSTAAPAPPTANARLLLFFERPLRQS